MNRREIFHKSAFIVMLAGAVWTYYEAKEQLGKLDQHVAELIRGAELYLIEDGGQYMAWLKKVFGKQREKQRKKRQYPLHQH